MTLSSTSQSVSTSNSTIGTIVQIVGNGNVIVPTHAHLALTRYENRRPIRREIDWLSPYTRSTPLIGRDKELSALNGFLSDARRILVRVLIGAPGRGKTRLALELCEQARAGGWDSGFVTHSELARFFRQENRANWGWQRPTLVVVDYAAQQAPGIAAWMDCLAERVNTGGPPLRILMVDRHAVQKVGWFGQIFYRGDFGDSARQALLSPPDPVRLKPLHKEQDRLALIECFRRRIAPACGLLTARERIALNERLGAHESARDPLYVMMATLAGSHLGDSRAFAFDRNELAVDLARREAARIRELAQARHLDPELTVHLAACVTLAQGMELAQFTAFAESEKKALGRPNGGDIAVLADVLAELLPKADGIAPIVPDLIGEAFVLEVLSKSDLSTVARCFRSHGIQVVQALVRCSQDFSPERYEPVVWLETIERLIADQPEELKSFYGCMPGGVTLQPMGLRVAQRLLDLCRAQPNLRAEEWAAALSRVAVASVGIGQAGSTLQAAREVVDAYRSLAAREPGRFEPDLAAALANLSIALHGTGDLEQADRASREAIGMFRALIEREPGFFEPGLAAALMNRVNILRELPEGEPAAQLGMEAVEQWRTQLDAGSEEFTGLLAAALNVAGNALTDAGELELGLYAVEEAVELYRDCAARAPNVYRGSLMLALNNLSASYIELDENESAFRAAEEAAALYEDVPAEHQSLFSPLIAVSHSHMAHAIWTLGEREMALGLAEKAVAECRVLWSTNPYPFRVDLAVALSNRAFMLLTVGQKEQALAVAREAIELFESVPAERSKYDGRARTVAFANFAILLAKLGMSEAAHRYAGDALVSIQKSVTERPGARGSVARGLLELLAEVRSVISSDEAGGARQ